MKPVAPEYTHYFSLKNLNDEIFHKSFSLILVIVLTSVIVALAESAQGVLASGYAVGRVANTLITALFTGIGLALIRFLLYSELLKKVYTFVLYLGSIVLALTEVFCLVKFLTKMSASVIQVILDTNNVGEINGFFGSYFDIEALIIILSFVFLGLSVFFFSERLYRLFAAHRKILAVFLIIVTGLSFHITGKVGGRSASVPLIRFLDSTKYILKVRYQIEKMCADKTNRVEIVSDNSDVPYFVFVIGESESRHFMSLYGCKYDSTPYFKELEKTGNLFAFTDVIAPRSVTALVMPYLLSFMSSVDDERDIMKYDPIVDVFNKADYQSFWLSNHEKITKDLSYSTYMSSRCDFAEFTAKSTQNLEFFSGLTLRDEVLLPPFEAFLEEKAPDRDKNLFVFQLMGSHIFYKDRYPDSFAKFKESDIDDFSPNQKKLVAEYLNSILYSDHILHEIIKPFKDKEAILVYVSDHGEEMWQGGFQGHAPANLSAYMVEIPMTIWVSDKYKEKHPKTVAAVKNAINRPYMTDNLVHTLLDLAKIQTKQYDTTKSVINDKFVEIPRIVNGIRYEDLRR